MTSACVLAELIGRFARRRAELMEDEDFGGDESLQARVRELGLVLAELEALSAETSRALVAVALRYHDRESIE